MDPSYWVGRYLPVATPECWLANASDVLNFACVHWIGSSMHTVDPCNFSALSSW